MLSRGVSRLPNHLLRRGGGRTPAARGPQPHSYHGNATHPKSGIPPGAVSPAMCRRLSGHAILCSQGKWGRGGVPRPDALGFLCPVRGCVEPSITLSEAACRWRHVRVLEVKIFYFFSTPRISRTHACAHPYRYPFSHITVLLFSHLPSSHLFVQRRREKPQADDNTMC